jgi:hypothetical protein
MKISRFLGLLLVSLLVFSLAFGAVAYRHNEAPDIFTDEIIYTRLGIRTGGEGALVWDSGETFGVHPPLYFLIEGGYFLLSGGSYMNLYAAGDVFQAVYHARLLNAFFAGLTAAALFLLGWGLDGPYLGLSLALLFLLDPFAIRINRRAMLETLAGLLSLVGMGVFLNHARHPERAKSRQRVSVIGAGLLLGASTLTKELTVINLAAILVFGAWEYLHGLWSNSRAGQMRASFRLPLQSLGVVVIAVLTYSLYPIWMALVGSWGAYMQEKLLGLQRLLGLVQLTGWNRPEISGLNLLLQRLGDYGSTYLILALGGLALLALMITDHRERSGRFLISWGAVLYPAFAFIALFGAANDQFFYYLLIPAMILVAKALWRVPGVLRRVMDSLPINLGAVGERIIELALTASILAFMSLILAFNLYQWVDKFALGLDNGYFQLKQFVEVQVSPDEPLNATGDPVKFHYFFPNRPITVAGDPQEARQASVHYFALAPKDIELGYGRATPRLAQWMQSQGRQLFSAQGSSYGALYLYRVDYSQSGSGAGFRIDPGGSKWRSFGPAQSGFIHSFVLMLMAWALLLTVSGLGAGWAASHKPQSPSSHSSPPETSELQRADTPTGD